MVRRSQGCRPVRPAVVRRPRQVRKEKDVALKGHHAETKDTNISDTQKHLFECYKLYFNFLFFANGGGVVFVLSNMNAEEYIAPLYTFSTGVFASTLLPLFWALGQIKTHQSNYIVKRVINIALKILTPLAFMAPVATLGFGIYLARSILEKG